MTGKPVPEGALFYATSKRRRVVSITPALRDRVVSATHEIRQMLATRRTPPPVNDDRCHACSLLDLCQPDALTRLADSRGAEVREHGTFRATDFNAPLVL